jgi:hypothetical protein
VWCTCTTSRVEYVVSGKQLIAVVDGNITTYIRLPSKNKYRGLTYVRMVRVTGGTELSVLTPLSWVLKSVQVLVVSPFWQFPQVRSQQ